MTDKKKHLLKEIRLNEVSIVDNPANPSAFIQVLKVEDEDAVMKGKYKEVLQESELDRKIQEMMEPMWDQSSVLRQSFFEVLRDEKIKDKGAALKTCVTEFADTLKSAIQQALNDIGKAAGDGGEKIKSKEDFTMGEDKKYDQAAVDQLVKDAVEKALKEAKPDPTLIALSEMSDAEKDYFNKLDDKGKKEFIGKSKDDRAHVVQKTAAKDEVLVIDNQEIHKSEVGETMFSVIKNQHIRMQEEIAKRVEAEYTKKAEKELPNVTGDAVMKGRLLHYLEDIQDDNLRKFALEVLKSTEGIAKMTKELGVSGEGVVHEDEFQKRVQEIANKDGISVAKATEKFMDTSEGNALYRKQYNR